MKNKKDVKKIIAFFISVMLIFSLTACGDKKETIEDKVMAIVNGQEIMDSEAEKFLTLYLFFNYGMNVNDPSLNPTTLDQFKYETAANILIDSVIIQEFLGDIDVMTTEAQAQLDATVSSLRSDETLNAELESMDVTDEDIADFYKYMFLTNAFIAKVNEENPVDDAMAEQYFEDHKTEFTSPASISASHILMGTAEHKAEDKAAAEEVLKRARSGEDFAALAKEFSTDSGSKDNGGALGTITTGQTVQPFETAVFALKNGEISDLVETEYGFHIIKATSDPTEPSQRTFDEVRDHIIAALQSENAAEKLLELKESAEIEYITAVKPVS